jgi:hypothetical protein
MARSWIEFIQSQRLPWERQTLAAVRPGAESKVLSRDDETGACSLLVRYPAGYEGAAGALAADDELLVLDGDLQVGERRFAPYAYAHWPAGYDAGAWRSSGGATVLEFFSAAPARAHAPIAYDPARLVEHVDALQVPYTGNFHPEFPPGAGRKILFQDPVTRDTTWLLGTLPLRWAERSEVHPTVEEMYLLAGEVHGNRGVMQPGAYFWRPGGVPHGPYGTKTGNLYFFRTKGGQLSTTYVPPEKPFRWWPEYDPVLPAELQGFRGDPPAKLRCF